MNGMNAREIKESSIEVDFQYFYVYLSNTFPPIIHICICYVYTVHNLLRNPNFNKQKNSHDKH